MTDFYVGQKVVCIQAPVDVEDGITKPIEGNVYSIRSIVVHDDSGIGFRLHEIKNPRRVYWEWNRHLFMECTFCASRFRPLVTTNIDVFLKMLEPTKSSEGVGALASRTQTSLA